MSGPSDTGLRAGLAQLLGVMPGVDVLPFSVTLSLSGVAVRARMLSLEVPEGAHAAAFVGDVALTEVLSGLSPAPVMPDGRVVAGASVARWAHATADGGVQAGAEGWVPFTRDVQGGAWA